MIAGAQSLSLLPARELLPAFFACATLASLLAVRQQQAVKALGKQPRSNHSSPGTVNGLGYAIISMFHINLTTVFIVDVLTWTVLWPMLSASQNT